MLLRVRANNTYVQLQYDVYAYCVNGVGVYVKEISLHGVMEEVLVPCIRRGSQNVKSDALPETAITTVYRPRYL